MIRSYLNTMIMLSLVCFGACFLLVGCAGHAGTPEIAKKEIKASGSGAGSLSEHTVSQQEDHVPIMSKESKPSITWTPSYKLKQVHVSEEDAKLPDMIVGSNINTVDGKVPLEDVIKQLASSKGMNVSWAVDVDNLIPVAVNIRWDANFWKALDEILRQVDYFYEYKNDTLIIKYKDTKQYYIANPFTKGDYITNVGGNFLGASLGTTGTINNTGSSNQDEALKGLLAVQNKGENLDLWKTIEENLTKILNTEAMSAPKINVAKIKDTCERLFPDNSEESIKKRNGCIASEIERLSNASFVESSKGQSETESKTFQKDKEKHKGQHSKELSGVNSSGFYFVIDRPLGIVTVTAPHSILKKVDEYIDHIKAELAKQVIIEAKIIEVTFRDETTVGIDWSQLLKNKAFHFQPVFGNNGVIYPTDGVKFLGQLTMTTDQFDVFLNFLKEFGSVKTLFNPKVSLLNGQPAMITGGQTTRIVGKVSSTIDTSAGSSTITYDVTTQDILSGIGLGVVANITSDEDIVLQLTPVTSLLQHKDDPENIRKAVFGSEARGFVRVDLPDVNIREMTTMAKVKSGQLLVIGGIIDEQKMHQGNKVPLLGDIPFIGDKLFGYKNTRIVKKELVILLRPQIVEL